ncbi:hypothetical protein PGTUg99_010270 [Puccinia graminis f. sp. tritici]|uniref:SLC26A/SulP transporter domain-containing protein n=1 Tax=Puccinia graminis f. sp. tritici TaxID=56615 RepID=A0A5B0S000_PUCGR|nr:hypothetical protein PGTUg99_010270 [Puccinia graminis f. sp. tritici]
MGDIPAYGSITRSKQNATAGAQTPTASIITGLTIIVTSYFLMDYLFFLLKCVLAVVISLVIFSLFLKLLEDFWFFFGTWDVGLSKL